MVHINTQRGQVAGTTKNSPAGNTTSGPQPIHHWVDARGAAVGQLVSTCAVFPMQKQPRRQVKVNAEGAESPRQSRPLRAMMLMPNGGTPPMRTNTTNHTGLSEVTILARVLGNGRGRLPPTMARYLLDRGFSEGDKARMHDLAVRNQDDALSPPEKEELLAWAKAGTVLSILKSKARRTLRIKPKKRSRSCQMLS
jgi:hypothetical protein